MWGCRALFPMVGLLIWPYVASATPLTPNYTAITLFDAHGNSYPGLISLTSESGASAVPSVVSVSGQYAQLNLQSSGTTFELSLRGLGQECTSFEWVGVAPSVSSTVYSTGLCDHPVSYTTSSTARPIFAPNTSSIAINNFNSAGLFVWNIDLSPAPVEITAFDTFEGTDDRFSVGFDIFFDYVNVDPDITASVQFSFDGTPLTFAPIPEPTSLVLLGTALAGLGAVRRRKRKMV